MLITKRDKSGYNKHSKNAKYSSPKIRSIVRTASDMTILKRRGRNLLTFCYGFKNIFLLAMEKTTNCMDADSTGWLDWIAMQ